MRQIEMLLNVYIDVRKVKHERLNDFNSHITRVAFHANAQIPVPLAILL